jgi:hypothetical protein
VNKNGNDFMDIGPMALVVSDGEWRVYRGMALIARGVCKTKDGAKRAAMRVVEHRMREEA